ncbi:MAG TPA: hypothetical protein VM534_08925 [Thermoanaerobaculia bacterium]|nr:hypothetical protein [Thermoanaerobaculia bacterium]
MPPGRILLILILIAAVTSPFSAQEPEVEIGDVYRVFIPVVGRVAGPAGVQWRSTLAIYNPNRTEVFVGVTLVSTEQPLGFTLGPGQSMVIEDPVGQSFGIDALLSLLEVASLGGAVSVGSTAWGILDDQTRTPVQDIPVLLAPLPPGVWALNDLRQDEVFRTTLGLANFGDDAVIIRVALQRIAGRNLAISELTLPPRSLLHGPLEKWFPLMPEGEDLTVIVDSVSSTFYAYASVVRNSDHAGRFVLPMPAGFAP